MALLKFLKGNYASLNSAAIAEGQILICGDTGEMFVDVAADKRVKIGDYVTVASLEALMAIDPASVPASRLYYVEGANILARSNGTSWDQINKDTGATSIEVVGDGNAVTAASYDATTRKLTLTKGETFATKAEMETADLAINNKIGTVAEGKTVVGLIDAAQTAADNAQAAAEAAQGDIDALETYVGTIPEGYTETNVIAYINKKSQETLDAASGGSSESAASVLAALNTYKAENDPKVAANTEAVAKAQAAAEAAQATADAAYVKPEDGINTSDLHADVVASLAKADSALQATDIENKADKATTLKGYGIADAYTKTEVDGLVGAKVDQTAYDEKVAALEDEDDKLAGLIGDNADAIEGVDAKVDTLVGEDAGKSVRTIANEELAAQLIGENAKESLDTLTEIAAWIQSHPDDASAMNAAIEALEAKVDTGDQTVSAYVTAAINALSIGDYATAAALAEAVGRIAALEAASATHATKTEMQAVADDLDAYKTAHAGDYTNTQVDAIVEVVQDQIDALGDTYATDAELTAAMEAEVTRANAAYAAKALETTVDEHVADAVAHITADERTAWNGAVSDLAAHKAAYDAKIEELVAEDADIRVDFAAADATLQSNIESVDAAYKAADEAINTEVAKKANSADVYTKDELIEMLSWAEF